MVHDTQSTEMFSYPTPRSRPIERVAEDCRIFDGATDRLTRSVCAVAHTCNKKSGIKIEWNDLINRTSGTDSRKGALDAIRTPTSNGGRRK
jgi:hypothetical protein